MRRTKLFLALAFTGVWAASAAAATLDDEHTVAALDTAYQAAVKHNDAAAMDRILDPKFVLVRGDGSTVSRDDLLKAARSGNLVFEHQEEDAGTQIVRVWGDTAVVTAKLWIKGASNGAPFERRLWFSDTYVRTPLGWRYAFGQASLPLASQ